MLHIGIQAGIGCLSEVILEGNHPVLLNANPLRTHLCLLCHFLASLVQLDPFRPAAFVSHIRRGQATG